MHVHTQELVDILSAHLYVQGIFPEPAALAFMTDRPPGKTAQQIFVLDFIPVRLHPLEKFIDTDDRILLGRSLVPVPYQCLFFLGEVAVRFENSQTIFACHTDQEILEPAHFIAFPAGDSPVVYAQCLVRHHQILAYANDFSQSAAHRTGPQRAVETEHIFVRLAESHAVRLEPVNKFLKR